jgi:hypothetical protein
MAKIHFWVSTCLLVLGSASALSCSQTASLNAVQGKVLHKGQPLSGAVVVLHPKAGAHVNSQPITALTKEDGTFSLTTGQTAGAPAGTYIVTISHPVPIKTTPGDGGMSMGGPPETEDSLHGAFGNRDTSQITVTIKDGPNQLEPFDLK